MISLENIILRRGSKMFLHHVNLTLRPDKKVSVVGHYDAGKKVSGIKRHISVDTQGLPHAVAVTTAEVADRKAGLKPAQRLLCDSGYVGQPFAQGVCGILRYRKLKPFRACT